MDKNYFANSGISNFSDDQLVSMNLDDINYVSLYPRAMNSGAAVYPANFYNEAIDFNQPRMNSFGTAVVQNGNSYYTNNGIYVGASSPAAEIDPSVLTSFSNGFPPAESNKSIDLSAEENLSDRSSLPESASGTETKKFTFNFKKLVITITLALTLSVAITAYFYINHNNNSYHKKTNQDICKYSINCHPNIYIDSHDRNGQSNSAMN